MSALLPVEEAQRRLLALRAPLDAEEMSPERSLGRYTAQMVHAARDQPAAPLSAMDGHAIRFADMPGPWTLAGDVAAGAVPSRALAPGEAVRIFTGAMLPDGADTIVVQEDSSANAARLRLTGEGPARRGAHVRSAASDFAAGSVLLDRGMRITPGAMAAAIMGGAAAIAVGQRPRVAIVTTGDELVPPGVPPAPGQIADSNGAMLAAMLASEPADISPPHRIGDDRAALTRLIAALASRHDVIVTVGGASVGAHDHVRAALADAGGRLDFWKVAMKPGKPLIAGTLGDALLLGLPGNPASAFVTATLFLLPLVRHLAGAAAPLPRILHAPLAAALEGGGARREYLRAVIDDNGVRALDGQDSGQTRPLAQANALLIRAAHAPPRAADEPADYIAIA